MAEAVDTAKEQAGPGDKWSCSHSSTLLRFAFAFVPIVAGVDKFFHILTNWDDYLSNAFNVLGNVHTTMMAVGIIEIIAGIGVAVKPRIFAYVVALWLLAIIINLLVLQKHYDIALRDFGLMFSALALGCLSNRKCCLKKQG